MAFYENTMIAKQDLPQSEIKKIIEKYNNLINDNSGKVVKVEEWGLINLSQRIKNYKKDFTFTLNLKEVRKLLRRCPKIKHR